MYNTLKIKVPDNINVKLRQYQDSKGKVEHKLD